MRREGEKEREKLSPLNARACLRGRVGRERTAEEEEKKQNCHVRERIGEVRCDA